MRPLSKTNMNKNMETNNNNNNNEPVKNQEVDLFGEPIIKDEILRDKFLEPPFSVLDTKTGSWQNRKRAWLRKGIQSEVGRGNKLLGGGRGNTEEQDQEMSDKYGRTITNGAGVFDNATSIFDPVLCELVYKWFCPEGGEVFDPFAGGSVRGIVANYLGYNYTGVDIRQEQIESNRAQALDILPVNRQPQWYCADSNVFLDEFLGQPQEQPQVYGLGAITPIEQVGEVWVKREDLFLVHGSNGAKSRSAQHLIAQAKQKGYKGITTAGSRKSPQINICARVAHAMGLEFHAHCPNGELGQELIDAKNYGAVIHQHVAGYNSVIQARCRTFAQENNMMEIPFGMKCGEAVEQTESQFTNTQLPQGVKRLVVCVGSGMNLAGLLWGIKAKKIELPVLGVRVGADPTKTLDEFAPHEWREMCTIVEAGVDYHMEVEQNEWGGIKLDPIYEAKCVKFLQPGDLFWVIGKRNTMVESKPVVVGGNGKQFDLLFSCPPYGDLEVYSDLEGDISNKTYTEFIKIYAEIIRKSAKLVKPGGLACFVIAEFRDKQGFYHGFVADTVKAFQNAGMEFYNDAVLLNALGTAMLRANKYMVTAKLVKVHQNVLVFKKPELKINKKNNKK